MSEPKDKDERQVSANDDPKQPAKVSAAKVTTESKDICDTTDDEKTDFEKVCTSETATVDSDKGDLSPTKSILSNGNVTISKRNLKKSVSFEPGEEAVKKFTEGDVIVDKKNPFKNGVLTTSSAAENTFVIRPRREGKNNPQVEVHDNDFVSTEEVLRESKYVTTYIKKPDKCFKYDPTIIARLKLEELRDTQVAKPVRKVNLSRQTQERLKELKSKYSPTPLYVQSKVPKVKQPDTTSTESKIPKYKRVSKSNYPDLSQLKIKTGTDIDESFFSPAEVALNAKRFDDRVKKLQIGSDDELDDIEEPLTNNDDDDTNADTVDSSAKEEPKKSFTNTVNSKEFQEFLNKKGLSLTPKEKIANGNAAVVQEKRNSRKPVYNIDTSYTSSSNMDSKREKKGSVFQRLLHTGLFSSKRKTTPKGPVPTPQNLYNKSNEDIKTSNNMKRVVLERQSFHGGSSNANSINDIRKQLEQSRKSYGGDDRDSSISSALTNAEDFADDHSTDSILELSNAHNDNRTTKLSNDKQNKLRNASSLNRDRNKDLQVRSVPSKSGDVRDVKPRSQRNSLSSKANDRLEKPVPAIRRSLERQSLVSRKPPLKMTDDGTFFSRSASMDRHDVARRTQKPNISIQKPIRNGLINQKSASMPRSLRENYVPRETSTPIQEKEPIKQVNRIIRTEMSPIPSNQVVPDNLNSGSTVTGRQNQLTNFNFNANSIPWAKLREMKERTDKELYVHTTSSQHPRNELEDIYERLPVSQAQPQTRVLYAAAPQPQYSSQLALNPNFLRGSPQRNTYSGGYGGQNFIPVRPKHSLPVEASVQVATQPPRSQSVLDDMLVPQQTAFGSVAGTPVIMRRKQNPSLSKEEILNRVRDFCRKSMNKTPTKMEANSAKLQSDISPVSYASVDYQGRSIPKLIAPQVPQRVHSLQYSQASPLTPSTSPIYAHVMKRGSIQSNVSDLYYSPTRKTQSLNRPRLPTTASDTSSVFLPANQQPTSPEPIIIMESENVTPAHVMKFRKRSGSEVYGQVYPNNPYGQIHIRQQQQQQQQQQQLHPSRSRLQLDGRSTPLILMDPRPSPIYWNTPTQPQPQSQPQQQQQQSIVYVRVKDQVYAPTNATRLQPPTYSPRKAFPYESESGSEAGEVQRIMQSRGLEEDWQNDKSGRNQSGDQAPDDRRRAARREDPRRHTLGGDMLQYGGQGQPQQRAMDLEMGTRAQKSKKVPPIRGYTPVNQGPLFDEDPGIMSEVETASTGFRRGGKQRSSLPVVRTPSKTLERPLGLVFLQYRSETKRALLPNEITSIDTVRALFVRSFPRQLTMAYLEGPNVKIYIHDASKDMFYELEDVRSHLREIRDRSVLRLFESNEVAAPQVLPGGPGVPQPLPPSGGGHWDQDQSYFSEPEFDSEYQHQHIHKSKGGKPAPYYVGGTQTLPRGMYSDRNKNAVDGYTSSPERGTRGGYEEPYYSQYGTRGSTVTPIIDEEQRCDGSLTDDQYSLYGMKVTGRIPRNSSQLYDPTRPEDLHRIRVEHMERQLANLTGLVQKALNQNPPVAGQVGGVSSNYLGVPGQCRGDKSVSFEKSVSFSDDIQGVPKSHSPQHAADTKPPKPAIKSSTLPRTSSQERDRLKPPPPPKPLALASTHPNYRPDIALAPEVYNHLRGLQKKAKDLRMEVRTLRRLSQAQAVAVREDIKDAFMRIRATLLASSGSYWGQGDQEKTRLSREEELYKQEVIRLEKDLSDLESSVEGLRGEVINRRTRVNMAAVEDMALVLSRASKTVAELKMRFPGLQQGLRNILSNEMEKVVREEKFLKDEPDRLESALRRCKKLTGTLVTLKRLASVQEQRLPVAEPANEDPPRSAEISSANKPVPSPRLGTVSLGGGIAPENALDALLDELQTFAKPQSGDGRPDDSTSDDSSQALQNTITTQLSQSSLFPNNDPNSLQVATNPNTNNLPNNGFTQSNMGSLRRLHSYPSGSDTDTSPPQPPRPVGKPPVPERNADLLSKVGNKRIPPPPPPRTSSRSPLASPTSPNVPQRLPSVCESDQLGNGSGSGQDGSGNSSGNESGNDHAQRQLALEMRHQELLKKQKMLQEQYARLQQMSKNSIALPPADIMQLKKTGSESNLPQKMGLSMTVTGSMKNLIAEVNVAEKNEKNLNNSSTSNESDNSSSTQGATPATTTNKVYETDIL